MPYLLNLLYLAVLSLLSPWLAYKALTTGKYRRGLWAKFIGTVGPLSFSARPRAWFHGVSVGEIHLLRQVIAAFRQHHPDWACVVSTTTDTGFDEARKRFPDLPVIYWPFDFSWAVGRALRSVQPALVVLAEGEIWPNFLLAAERQAVPVAVINARMSPRSFARYQRLGGLVRRLLGRISLFVVQTDEYADNFRRLGALPGRVVVSGNVKYDGVQTERDNPRTQELRRLLHLGPDELVWIAGSTQAPEEEIALDIFRRALVDHPHLRLILVPRQRERFDEVAALLSRRLQLFARRTQLTHGSPPTPVLLVDTIGELSALWGLADVAFVGGSLDGKRGGQNMIEPAAYGAAVVFGPHVWNFRADAERLTRAEAALQVSDGTELEGAVRRLLGDATERQRLGAAARGLVLRQQGATQRTIELLDQLLPAPTRQRAA
jgi:3-deoxy-D-manno-octulosonic-acid transferase